jgi:penicillin amidase
MLDAYAAGVNHWLERARDGEESLPPEVVAISVDDIPDWTPGDSLALGRFQQWSLSESLSIELDAQEVADGVRAVFRPDAEDPAIAVRAGILVDLFRFAPADSATVLPGFPGKAAAKELEDDTPPGTPLSPDLSQSARATQRALRASKQLLGFEGRSFGSNNWAVSGALSKSGRALLASDPHLPLSSPSVLWPTHLIVDDPARPSENLDVAGMAFPGIPGVILGFNAHVAWGATVAFFDVTDIYQESLSEDGKAVYFQDQLVPLEEITETIQLPDGDSYDLPVWRVPHHGPILPRFDAEHRALPLDPAAGALSVRWTGFEQTNELATLLGLWRARDVGQVREALKGWGAGAQNWMVADDSGNVLYSAESLIPVRDPRALVWDAQSFSGKIPCLVLPGDGSAEWQGFLDDEFVPQLENPVNGWVATANADQVGTTLDNDPTNDLLPDGEPGFLSCFYDLGFRTGRIQEMLHAAEPASLDLDAMASMQGDDRSTLGPRLLPRLRAVLDVAKDEADHPGTHPALSAVVASARYQAADIPDLAATLGLWADEADFRTPSGLSNDDGTAEGDSATANASKATLVFNAWLTRLLGRVFLDEVALVPVQNGSFDSEHGIDDQIALRSLLHLMEVDPATLATYNSAAGDSWLWDDLATPEIESRGERMLTALLDAVDDLNLALGEERDSWRWGALHRVAFASLVPLWLMRIPDLDDPVFSAGFPRHGDAHTVDACQYDMSRAPDEKLSFSYGSGPAQRFVIELDPAGPRARNTLPGGAVWNKSSTHFSDEAERWRRNQNHDVPYSASAVLAAIDDDGVRTLVP